jgi:hypothetical protein
MAARDIVAGSEIGAVAVDGPVGLVLCSSPLRGYGCDWMAGSFLSLPEPGFLWPG